MAKAINKVRIEDQKVYDEAITKLEEAAANLQAEQYNRIAEALSRMADRLNLDASDMEVFDEGGDLPPFERELHQARASEEDEWHAHDEARERMYLAVQEASKVVGGCDLLSTLANALTSVEGSLAADYLRKAMLTRGQIEERTQHVQSTIGVLRMMASYLS